MGRATQGVRLIRLDDDDEIASVAKVEVEDEEQQSQVNPEPTTESSIGDEIDPAKNEADDNDTNPEPENI